MESLNALSFTADAVLEKLRWSMNSARINRPFSSLPWIRPEKKIWKPCPRQSWVLNDPMQNHPRNLQPTMQHWMNWQLSPRSSGSYLWLMSTLILQRLNPLFPQCFSTSSTINGQIPKCTWSCVARPWVLWKVRSWAKKALCMDAEQRNSRSCRWITRIQRYSIRICPRKITPWFMASQAAFRIISTNWMFGTA